ncbi:MAG: heme exporter protein CcmB [Acidimicrobiales bacterium]
MVAAKDLRIELRSRVVANQVLPFAGLVLVLFAFALDADPTVLHATGGGLFWVAVLFATVLAVQRSVAVESGDGGGDGLRMAGIDPAGVFLGKAAAVGAQLLALEAVLTIAVAILYHLRLQGDLVLAGSAILGTAGLAAAGTIYGALSATSRVRETLLPLLFLPVVAPVLLSAARAWQFSLAGHPGQGAAWLRFLGVFAVVYLVAGTLAYEPIMEDG